MDFILDCSDCERRGVDHCEDCVVAYLLDHGEEAVVFNLDEERAIRALGEGGLLPQARFKERIG